MLLPIHLIQPLEKPHDNPISNVYSEFRNDAREALADGAPVSAVLGPPELDAGAVLSDGDYASAGELSRWAGQLVSSRDELSIASKLGIMFLIFKFMRVSWPPKMN